MKIYECCPFLNENLICMVKIRENKKWADELHIAESNKTHSYRDKQYCFEHEADPFVRYHQLDGPRLFKRPKWGISRYPWFIKYKKFTWHNEGFQRNYAAAHLDVRDDDIVVLSDVDEIIDHKCADEIIAATKKHGIITVKLHFSCYYFNLYLRNRGGPADYSYRVFVMTGRYFRQMKRTSDQLRKSGEASKLLSEVFCMEKIVGFHHSWIGGVDQIVTKLVSYAHAPEDHHPQAFVNGVVNRDYIVECLKNHKSIYSRGPELFVDNNIPMMESVEELRSTHPDLFLPNS